MTGLIWFVQMVHYPLFADVGVAGFGAYATEHSLRTSWVVVPVMLLEMGTAIWLASVPPPSTPRRGALAGLGALALIWISTIFVQVPRHERLGAGFDAETVATLVTTNWLRTSAWTFRAVLVLTFLASTIRSATRNEST
jgi:hypothetical protein